MTDLLLRALVLGCLSVTALAQPAVARPEICLITKSQDNPLFVRMRNAAVEAAAAKDIALSTFAGRSLGDVEAQVAAVEACIAARADGIMIAPNDSRALVPVVRKARAAGIMIVALDTEFEPVDTADATYATDNYLAGVLVGEWARGRLGAEAAEAKIALLNLNASGVSADYQRVNGFLEGFGIAVTNATRAGSTDDPRVVGIAPSNGTAEGGRTAMENLLLLDPGIDLVFTINEPAAAGAFQTLRAFGVEDDIVIVSVDGGCPGVRDVAAGVIGATSMQFPDRMAEEGINAIARFLKTGAVPQLPDGRRFFDTGTELVTDAPVDGLVSMSSDIALGECWG
ncbi:MAG: substrate-binding domain-containing protein [Pseudomonadota bacterium]